MTKNVLDRKAEKEFPQTIYDIEILSSCYPIPIKLYIFISTGF